MLVAPDPEIADPGMLDPGLAGPLFADIGRTYGVLLFRDVRGSRLARNAAGTPVGCTPFPESVQLVVDISDR